MKDLPNMGPDEVKKPVIASQSTTVPLSFPLGLTNSNGQNPLAGNRKHGRFISRWKKELIGGILVLLISWAVMKALE